MFFHPASGLDRPTPMRASRVLISSAALCVLAWTGSVIAATAQRAASESDRKEASREVPLLVDVLELKPGMSVADIGAGAGALSLAMSRWLSPSGRMYATEVSSASLEALRAAKTREGLENLVVIEGAAGATNLPDACCDGIFIRNVYHHITQPAEFNRSMAASLRPGGRLAVIDFAPRASSELPQGVPTNRGGHGVPPSVVEQEVSAAGLVLVKTMRWPPKAERQDGFLVLFRRPES
jgi:predicted methyltransferase